MRTRMTIAFLLIALAVAWPQAAWSQQTLTIDDFTTGGYGVTLRSGQDLNFQTGSMVGGGRRTRFFVAPPNPYNQPSSFDIRPEEGALVISSGLKSVFRLEVYYGLFDAPPLNLDLSGYDRFRVNFDASDLVLNFNIVVFTETNYAQLGYNVEASTNPFSVDFPFADFGEGTGVDFRDIDSIVLIFQSGSAIMGNDFAVTSIVAMPPSAP